MTQASQNTELRLRGVRAWLLALCVLVGAMVLVGGATRLTESGLSIVEWKPVTGALPPLSDADWSAAFEAYKTIPQYRELNAGMTLAQYKTIFWWEWAHRLLGRVVGVVFFLPFLYFLWRGVMGQTLKRRLWVIFGLGALQGAVGWWMVASGLTHRVDVSQYRLAVHLMLALAIFAALLWTLRQISATPRWTPPRGLAAGGVAVLALVFLQIYFGALVAGLRAGRVFNTWPDIDGAIVPDTARLFFEVPWWRNFFDNALTVQFSHRMTAYALLAAVLAHLVHAVMSRRGQPFRFSAALLAIAVALQGVLGILTLVRQAPLDLALSHQALALGILTIAVIHAERLTGNGSRASVRAEPALKASSNSKVRGALST